MMGIAKGMDEGKKGGVDVDRGRFKCLGRRFMGGGG